MMCIISSHDKPEKNTDNSYMEKNSEKDQLRNMSIVVTYFFEKSCRTAKNERKSSYMADLQRDHN